jgi:hypothetical protein
MICQHTSCSRSRAFRRCVSVALTIALMLTSMPPVFAQSVVSGLIAGFLDVRHGHTQHARSFPNSARNARTPRTPQGGGANRGMPSAPPSSASDSPRRPHTKTEREARVVRLKINLPRNPTVEVGRSAHLMAVPFDADDNPVHGVMAEWQSSRPEIVSVTSEGEAVAIAPGVAVLTGSAAGKRVVVPVMVVLRTATLGTERGDRTVAQASSSIQAGRKNRRQSPRSLLFAHNESSSSNGAPVPLGGDQAESLYKPSNAVGAPPGKTTPGAKTRGAAIESTETPGSSNFSFGRRDVYKSADQRAWRRNYSHAIC